MDDLQRLKGTLTEKEHFMEPTRKNFNKDRPIQSAAKCSPIILVSRNTRCMQIFVGFLGKGGVVGDSNFHCFHVLSVIFHPHGYLCETFDGISRTYIQGAAKKSNPLSYFSNF